ncbi:hypothetical protein [Bradyrhizobium sp. USDA 3364]
MFGLFSALKWNSDPNQQRLALIILDAAKYDVSRGASGKLVNIREMFTFTQGCGWDDKEASNRFIHAVSMLKPMVDPATFKAAKEIGQNLYNAYRA